MFIINEDAGCDNDTSGGSATVSSSSFEECDGVCLGNAHILFLITQDAGDWLVNINNYTFYIDLMISDLEQTWLNSNVGNTVTWDIDVINFDTSSNCEDNADNLSNDPAAQQLRSQYGADIVILLFDPGANSPGDSQGCVAAIGPAQDEAYGIIPVDLALSDFLFVHEFNHLFGGQHEFHPNAGDCAFAFDIYLSSYSFSTVMGISSLNGRIPHLSDPDINWAGQPTGNIEFNPDRKRFNAGMVKKNGCVISNFMDTPGIFSNIDVEVETDCDILLNAYISPDNPNYSYEWYWNFNGLFTSSDPGEFLGVGNNLSVEEPVTDNCSFYFIKLDVVLNGSVVSTSIKSQNGGVCTYNVLPCNWPSNFVTIENSTLNSVISLDVEPKIKIISIDGQVLGILSRLVDINQLNLTPGLYLIQYFNGVETKTTKHVVN